MYLSGEILFSVLLFMFIKMFNIFLELHSIFSTYIWNYSPFPLTTWKQIMLNERYPQYFILTEMLTYINPESLYLRIIFIKLIKKLYLLIFMIILTISSNLNTAKPYTFSILFHIWIETFIQSKQKLYQNFLLTNINISKNKHTVQK